MASPDRATLPSTLALALMTAMSACGDDTTSTSISATETSSSGSSSSSTDGTTSGTPTTGSTSASGSETMGETLGTTGEPTTGTSTSSTTTGSTTAVTSSTTTDSSSTTSTTDSTTAQTSSSTSSTTGVPECNPGDSQDCFPFPESGVGECVAGTQQCVDGAWGPCEGAVGPAPELCDKLDNNCDNAIDETCVCGEGETQPCYPGPEGTQDVGICEAGTQACVVMDGMAMWGECTGFTLPELDDACNDTLDNDCDGFVDVQEVSLGLCTDQMITPAVTCTNDQLMPNLGGLTKVAFNYTGADQNFVVPNGKTSIWVKLWGAGGGSWDANQGGPGGAGGFALAKLAVTPGEALTVIVGQRGQNSFSQTMVYGGGGHGGFFAGNGGGRSALRRGMTELATAGGGGGAGGCNVNQPCPGGGAGGGATGEDGKDPPLGDMTYGTHGFGATQTCGGAGGTSTCGCDLGSGIGGGGSQFQGGVTIMGAPGQGGGGGGGGWFGGGSGGGDCAGNTGGGGGGGSSRVDPADGCVVAGAGMTAANSTDPDHAAGIGNGGMPGSDGNPGLVVIYH